ncbi:hypothetical protein B0A50_08094 [Salinomyces thailandicus]|uniref:Inclusion body clearance protein IML2 n=1 Tax=Salinomyces thailandicus TaxID=706561 RepID=A0A4U0TKS3_9PEZI|nr:hypothetical protein B0A50_08094 [Salinomyces thailandica]
MKRFGGLLGGKAGSSASKSLTALDEPHALQEALAAAALILNDEVEQAEAELAKGTSPFHKLGRATALFLQAALGFEKPIMEQAAARIAEAEESASEHQRRAIRDPSSAHQSKIYPVGAEYALCHAETQLMSAVVAVLNESLTESLKGFYKLRKAFGTLYEISEAERKYLAARGKGWTNSESSSGTSASTGAEDKASNDTKTSAESSGVLTPDTVGQEDDADLDFVDAEEAVPDQMTPGGYQGHLEPRDLANLKLEDADRKLQSGQPPSSQPSTNGGIAKTNGAVEDADSFDIRTVTSDPIDLFIHSGTCLCFGLLQLLLSMVPPAFAKLLSLFSFRGDRETGFRMLWSATKFKQNINGGFAGLITLGFHNGAIAFCDIITKDAMPITRLASLLREMRELYPKSRLWLLEEARMLGADHQLEKAVSVMSQGGPSPLKQVEALRTFEKALALMFLHRYEECAQTFIACVGMNNWSPGLYYYIAGACHVELYRVYQASDPVKAQESAAKADKYLHEVTSHTGKKRFMARQLPFDLFVNRKIAKWEQRAKTRNCSFVDAVGVSPIAEMSYFWSGFRRMNEEQLLQSIERLAWSEAQPQWQQQAEALDEQAILALLKATCLRFLGKLGDAKKTLEQGVLAHDAVVIKGCPHADNYTPPVAHYEMAVCLWDEAGGQDGDRGLLEQCSQELLKTERWEGFDLDARVGLKVATARQTLVKCGIGSV